MVAREKTSIMFNHAVIGKLGFYVYLLQDPRNEEIFYVGKGTGNRVFQHVDGAIYSIEQSMKLDQIRDITDDGLQVKHIILRHGLTESAAFELEAAMIDFSGIENLANEMGGHYSSDYGMKSADEIVAMYDAKELITKEPILLININKDYRREMTVKDLYEATRLSWVLGIRREKVRYAIPVYRGLTREVYDVRKWFPVSINGKIRWGFKGRLAQEDVEMFAMHWDLSR